MALLRVVKVLSPGGDPGRFNLQIDGETLAPDAGRGGTTGRRMVVAGPHTVGETGTSLGDYTSSIQCRSGDGGPVVASGSGAGPVSVTLAPNDRIACAITNRRKPPPPIPPAPPVPPSRSSA